MDELFEILKLILPAGIVFLTAFYILKQFFQNEEKKRIKELRHNNSGLVTPLRLQAYERIILFLERISPESILLRVNKPGMSARMLHSELLQTIRTEFEHNISQQVFVSNAAWDLVKRAKEETIKIINIASTRVSDNSSGLELSKAVFKVASELDKLPGQIAIDYMKKEVRQSF